MMREELKEDKDKEKMNAQEHSTFRGLWKEGIEVGLSIRHVNPRPGGV